MERECRPSPPRRGDFQRHFADKQAIKTGQEPERMCLQVKLSPEMLESLTPQEAGTEETHRRAELSERASAAALENDFE